MAFNSYSYVLLLAIVVTVFWLMPPSWRLAYLLAASVAFYASWNVAYAALPLAVAVLAYVCARMMLSRPEQRRLWMWSGVTVVVGVLVTFKYERFLAGNVNSLLAVAWHPALPVVALVLPLGISFYTFECVSYLVDTRQGRCDRVTFAELCLFVMFWPHLIAGPIVRTREIIPQFRFTRSFDPALLRRGIDRFVWGLVQKNLLANTLAAWVDEGFLPRSIHSNTTIDNWFLAAGFGLQIYFDFAAYSNLAIGAAMMMGITLPENFRFPYLSATPAEFWSRWHMTLSRWVRDYLFFPVNARYGGRPLPLYASLVGVMALIGLWHGAGWGFLLWGTLHGVYQVLFRLADSAYQRRRGHPMTSVRANNRARSGRLLLELSPLRLACRLATIVAVVAAWVPFRAPTLALALQMLRSMFASISVGMSYSINFYLVTLLVALFCTVEPLIAGGLARLERGEAVRPMANAVNLWALRPVLWGVALALFMMFDEQATAFIYFQF